jgi:translation initiation factor 3 subunit I
MKFVEFNQKPGHQNMVVTCNDKLKSSTDPVPNRIMVWQFEPLKKLLSIDKELPMAATKVKWGPYDETLVSIFEEGTICVWDATKGDLLHTIEAHRGPCTNINFTEDRMLMISCGKDGNAKLWAMDDYENIQTYETDRPLNDVVISPLYDASENPKYHILMGGGQDAKDVTTTASSSGKFETLLWHMVFCEEIGSIKGHFGPMNTLAWRRDGKGFVTGGEDGYVRSHMWDKEYFTSNKFA